MAVAIVTGASRGLGEALASGLGAIGWSLVVDARHAGDLEAAEARIRAFLADGAALVAIPGDVVDSGHRRQLVAAALGLGGVDLVVNNAGTLGPSPLPALTDLSPAELEEALRANLVAPLGLIQEAAAALDESPSPKVINLTSDASIEAYPGWGGYGMTKAALDHMSAVLAVERPRWRVCAFDPGDMRTRMHQDAFPGEDISDRPEPASVVPAVLALVASDRPSGRVRASELAGASA